MDTNIKNQIIQKLRETEEMYHVKILLAIESGSRGWGFAAENADYDCRFIYVHKKDWYLSVLDKQDFIEYPIDEVFDIKGYDITRALKHIMKPQAVMYEYLSSNEGYICDMAIVRKLQALALDFFNPIPISYHYLGLAKKTLNEIIATDTAKIKKYFYVLRPIANLNFIWQYRKMPYMEYFQTLEELDLNPEISQAINELTALKMSSKEHDLVPQIRLLVDYFDAEIAKFDSCIKEMTHEKNRNYAPVDDIFRSILEDVWR